MTMDNKIRNSERIIMGCIEKVDKLPLIINFSGGKDSQCVLALVRELTDNFVCFYMSSGIEFPEAIDFVRKTCRELGVKLIISYPSDYKGDFFQRLAHFHDLGRGTGFPWTRATWCSRDLKLRPQRNVLRRLYGRNMMFKLVAVRRHESKRREKIYKSNICIVRDPEQKEAYMVYPILDWTDDDVKVYLKQKSIIVPPNPLYEKYGVSGCYWCPFYQASIYRKILRCHPNLYDRWIEWERRLGKPCVNGQIFMSDLKREIVELINERKVY